MNWYSQYVLKVKLTFMSNKSRKGTKQSKVKESLTKSTNMQIGIVQIYNCIRFEKQ